SAGVGRPGVLGPAAAGTLVTAALGALGALAAAEPAAAAVGPGDLGGCVPQGRADVVDLDLVDGPLLAFLRLVIPLPEPAGDDDPHAPLQALGHVLGRLPPHVAGQEEAVAVLPLPTRGVADAGRRGDPERGYRLPGRSESEFRIGNKVADYRDLGVTCRHRGAPGR